MLLEITLEKKGRRHVWFMQHRGDVRVCNGFTRVMLLVTDVTFAAEEEKPAPYCMLMEEAVCSR